MNTHTLLQPLRTLTTLNTWPTRIGHCSSSTLVAPTVEVSSQGRQDPHHCHHRHHRHHRHQFPLLVADPHRGLVVQASFLDLHRGPVVQALYSPPIRTGVQWFKPSTRRRSAPRFSGSSPIPRSVPGFSGSSPAFRGHYGAFSPTSSLPTLDCGLLGSPMDEAGDERLRWW
ncbi:hypothetical protein VIGAN_03185100 [Vigna angularis var. angularis]|uniref:Uncharacterized protein n=1 Tax=Vigna angularis var. angularis TaxID=157739 RepID=A0A0S3RMW3_PHAAN|nr:hypothetical protein VIGAN_03185100 [Vigna angularis var. angularis]